MCQHPGLTRWALNPVTPAHMRYTQREDPVQKAGSVWCSWEPPEAACGKELSRKGSGKSPSEPLGEVWPSWPWFQTSALQNYNRITFCCFKSSALWYFVWTTTGNWHSTTSAVFCILKISHRSSPYSRAEITKGYEHQEERPSGASQRLPPPWDFCTPPFVCHTWLS